MNYGMRYYGTVNTYLPYLIILSTKIGTVGSYRTVPTFLGTVATGMAPFLKLFILTVIITKVRYLGR